MVPVPTLSGPTSGRVIEEELEEWARQAHRWTIGAAEVFHYFMVKSTNIPFFTALSWGITFIIYYGNYLSMYFVKCQETKRGKCKHMVYPPTEEAKYGLIYFAICLLHRSQSFCRLDQFTSYLRLTLLIQVCRDPVFLTGLSLCFYLYYIPSA